MPNKRFTNSLISWVFNTSPALIAALQDDVSDIQQRADKIKQESSSSKGKGFEAYLQGNILKYLWRYDYKNGVEDLKKAKWYLSELIEIRNDNKS
mgnify:CR=1 FL=1